MKLTKTAGSGRKPIVGVAAQATDKGVTTVNCLWMPAAQTVPAWKVIPPIADGTASELRSQSLTGRRPQRRTVSKRAASTKATA